MKFNSMRGVLALALVLSLTACGGGGKATFTIGGNVSNLAYSGLVLTTNGMDVAVSPPASTSTSVAFQFPKQLEYGDVYDVTVKNKPQHQTCAIPNGTDTAGRLSQISIVVNCSLVANTIGGSITGLTADGLVLNNGSTTYTVASGATKFTFANSVTYGETYGVTVHTQPTGLVCSVANGAGTMGDDPVDTIAVTCNPAT